MDMKAVEQLGNSAACKQKAFQGENMGVTQWRRKQKEPNFFSLFDSFLPASPQCISPFSFLLLETYYLQ